MVYAELIFLVRGGDSACYIVKITTISSAIYILSEGINIVSAIGLCRRG